MIGGLWLVSMISVKKVTYIICYLPIKEFGVGGSRTGGGGGANCRRIPGQREGAHNPQVQMQYIQVIRTLSDLLQFNGSESGFLLLKFRSYLKYVPM